MSMVEMTLVVGYFLIYKAFLSRTPAQKRREKERERETPTSQFARFYGIPTSRESYENRVGGKDHRV